MRARTALVNTARGLTKSYGERLRGCNLRNMNPEKAQGLSPELRTALEPLLTGIESLSERIRECNERIERLARESYPQVAQLKQVKGVGTLIALTFLLTLEDAYRVEPPGKLGKYLVHHGSDRAQRMIFPHSRFRRQVTEHMILLLIVSAYAFSYHTTLWIGSSFSAAC